MYIVHTLEHTVTNHTTLYTSTSTVLKFKKKNYSTH